MIDNMIYLKKYYGTDKFFMGLYGDESRDLLIYGRVINPKVTAETNFYNLCEDIKNCFSPTTIPFSHTASVSIPFVTSQNDNILFHMVRLNNTQEFDTIKLILENFYNEQTN